MKFKKFIALSLFVVLTLVAPFGIAETARGRSMGYTLNEWLERYNAKAALYPNAPKITPLVFTENDDRLWYMAAIADHVTLYFMTDIETEALVGISIIVDIENCDYDEGEAAGAVLLVASSLIIWSCDDSLPGGRVDEIRDELINGEIIAGMEVGDDLISSPGEYRYSFARSGEFLYMFTARLLETE